LDIGSCTDDSVVALLSGFDLVEVCCCRWRYGSW